jgi:hypothetical protein
MDGENRSAEQGNWFLNKIKLFGKKRYNFLSSQIQWVIQIPNSLFNRLLTGWLLNLTYDGISVEKELVLKIIYMNVVYFLLGNSPASEFYMPTFRNTLSVPSSQADRYEGWLGLKMLEYLYRKSFGSKITWASRKEGDPITLLPIGSGYFRNKPFPI